MPAGKKQSWVKNYQPGWWKKDAGVIQEQERNVILLESRVLLHYRPLQGPGPVSLGLSIP